MKDELAMLVRKLAKASDEVSMLRCKEAEWTAKEK